MINKTLGLNGSAAPESTTHPLIFSIRSCLPCIISRMAPYLQQTNHHKQPPKTRKMATDESSNTKQSHSNKEYLHKPTHVAEGVEKQAPFSALHPRSEIPGQVRNPIFDPAAQIKPENLPWINDEGHGVNASGVVPLHVPLQVLRLGPEPAQQHHRHFTVVDPERTHISFNAAVERPVPGGNTVV